MFLSFLTIPVYSCSDKNNKVDKNEQELQKHDAIKKEKWTSFWRQNSNGKLVWPPVASSLIILTVQNCIIV
jgi:hypothetical protein